MVKMRFRLPTEYVDQPLLKRVRSHRNFVTARWSIMTFLTLIKWQVTELADEELLKDAEILFA